MKLYIVFVTFKVPGPSGSHSPVRYVDSQWASRDHAVDRKDELYGSLKMGKAPEHFIEIICGTVADAQIAESTSPAPNTDATSGQPVGDEELLSESTSPPAAKSPDPQIVQKKKKAESNAG